MYIDLSRPCVALLCAAMAGCAGNGQGLDANGQPLADDNGNSTSAPLTADFQSIQEHVFTPICSKCHIGASAPEGLQLDEQHSYDMLIGVTSAEESALMRIAPGDPDDSYLVKKIEGAPGIEGGQMPLGESPLPQATIDAIRQWITNGAPETGAADGASPAVFALRNTSPQNREIATLPVGRILLSFTDSVDSTLVNDTTIVLERIDTHVPERIALTTARIDANPRVVSLMPQRALTRGAYRVTIRGSGGAALANLNAVTLGSDASFEFGVEIAP